jgi:hypothetical protein
MRVTEMNENIGLQLCIHLVFVTLWAAMLQSKTNHFYQIRSRFINIDEDLFNAYNYLLIGIYRKRFCAASLEFKIDKSLSKSLLATQWAYHLLTMWLYNWEHKNACATQTNRFLALKPNG